MSSGVVSGLAMIGANVAVVGVVRVLSGKAVLDSTCPVLRSILSRSKASAASVFPGCSAEGVASVSPSLLTERSIAVGQSELNFLF